MCSPRVIKILDLRMLILWSSYYLPGFVLKDDIIILLEKASKLASLSYFID